MDGGHEKVPRGLAGRVAPAGAPILPGYLEDLPSEVATTSLWEACWQANRQRLRAFAAKRSAARAASRSSFVADPWETSMLANSCPQVLGYSLASKLPTAAWWQIRGRPACWRIPALRCWDIRLPASFPQRLRGGSVGDQLAGELLPSGVGIFACQQASHSGLVADPWETSLLANSCPQVLGYSLASKLPTAASWRIRGRPACWRI